MCRLHLSCSASFLSDSGAKKGKNRRWLAAAMRAPHTPVLSCTRHMIATYMSSSYHQLSRGNDAIQHTKRSACTFNQQHLRATAHQRCTIPIGPTRCTVTGSWLCSPAQTSCQLMTTQCGQQRQPCCAARKMAISRVPFTATLLPASRAKQLPKSSRATAAEHPPYCD